MPAPVSSQPHFLARLGLVAMFALSPLPGLAQSPPGPVEDKPRVITEPVAVERPPPRYPDSQSDRYREGWVVVRLTVRTDGTVGDIAVADASGKGEFGKAALEAVRQWRFTPATVDGAPVEYQNLLTRLTFVMRMRDEDRGARREFVSGVRDADDLLKDGKVAEARAKLEALEAGSIYLYEYPYFYSRMARIEIAEGDPEGALAMMDRAVGLSQTVDRKLRHALMQDFMRLALRLGHFREALDTAEKLTGERGEIPPEIAAGLERGRALSAGREPFIIPARVGADCGYELCAEGQGAWRHEPLRNAFSLAAVQGRLDTAQGRCGLKTFTAKAEVGITWTVPQSWGECRIQVFGAPGTTFDFVSE